MSTKKEGWVNCFVSSKKNSKEHSMHIFGGQKKKTDKGWIKKKGKDRDCDVLDSRAMETFEK